MSFITPCLFLNPNASVEADFQGVPFSSFISHRQHPLRMGFLRQLRPLRRLYQRIFAIEFSILRTDEYPIPSIIDTVNFTAHPPPTYSVNGRLPTLQRSSKATDIKKRASGCFV